MVGGFGGAFVVEFGIDPEDIVFVEYDWFGEFESDDEGNSVEWVSCSEFVWHVISLCYGGYEWRLGCGFRILGAVYRGHQCVHERK